MHSEKMMHNTAHRVEFHPDFAARLVTKWRKKHQSASPDNPCLEEWQRLCELVDEPEGAYCLAKKQLHEQVVLDQVSYFCNYSWQAYESEIAFAASKKDSDGLDTVLAELFTLR